MPDNRIEIHYRVSDVTSAQRMRIFKSRQFIPLLAMWGIGVLFVALHALFPGVFKMIPGVSWEMVGQLFAAYLGSVVVLLYAIPWISFWFTRYWHIPLQFQYNSKSLRLNVLGKKGGLQLNWEDIQSFEENKRVFVFFYAGGSKHFILPKSAFPPAAAARFRTFLDSRFGTFKSLVIDSVIYDDLEKDA